VRLTGERPAIATVSGGTGRTAIGFAASAHGEEAAVRLALHIVDVTRPGGAPRDRLEPLRTGVRPAIEGR